LEQIVKTSMSEGHWVLLQNCHLALDWISMLDKELASVNADSIHVDFRLWLTCKSTEGFPLNILQRSIKYNMEPPTRIKSSMITLYRDSDDTNLNTCKKPTQFRRLTWGLNFFHSILWSRGKFGQIGWSKSYDFNAVDHMLAIERLRQYLNASEERNEDVPYKTLLYLTSEVLYGGHVTDPRDLQTLRVLLADFYNSSIMEEKYTFTSKEVYLLPPDGGLAIDSYLNQLPYQDDPETLGYSENIKGYYNKLEATKFFETLAIVHSSPNVLSKKDILTLISEIQRKLPAEPLQTEHKDFVHDGILGAILQQEVAILNSLRLRMNQMLNLLKYALEKDFASLKMVNSMYRALMSNQVPKEWQEYESNLNLHNWMEDLKARFNFFQTWLENGTPNVLWIGAFAHPQAIFSYILQVSSRKARQEIDTLVLDFEILAVDSVTSPPEDGLYLSGFYLEGAKWETFKLDEMDQSTMIQNLPLILCRAKLPKFITTSNKFEYYHCPVYKSSSRGQSNFVTSIRLPTTLPERHWTKRSVVMLTHLDL